ARVSARSSLSEGGLDQRHHSGVEAAVESGVVAGAESGGGPSGGGVLAGGSGSAIGGSSGVPVIRREPRPWVRKLHAQRTVTTSRFANPIRYTMWIDSQSAHAKNPLWRPNGPSHGMSVTPARRPMTATSPLFE